MTRSRNKNKEKSKPQQEQSAPKPQALNTNSLESYGLNLMQSFIKADDDIFVIVYRVNAGNLAKEEIINKYKNTMMTALQAKAREKGMLLSADKIIFNCLPLGEDCLIKAFGYKRDITKKSGEPVIDRKVNDPLSWDVKVKG